MKRLILASAMIMALGAGSVLMAQNSNAGKKAKPAAAKKTTAKNSNSGAAAASTGGTMKASGKKHRKHRKHAKKS